MRDLSTIEDIFTGHWAPMSLIPHAEFDTVELIDSEHIGGISKCIDPLDPRKPIEDAGQFD